MSATITRGYSFGSTEQVTNSKLHSLVDSATITGITDSNVDAAAAIAYSKLSIGAAAINYDRLNLTGGIVNADVSSSAAIAYSKLALTGAVLNADLAGSIADSKLSQITTASKVSGTAITGLASLPSGAGVIPAANLPTPGAMTLVSTTPVSSAAASGNIAIDSTFLYLVQIVATGGSGGGSMQLQFNGDTTNGHYQYNVNGYTPSSSTIVMTRSASAAAILLNQTGHDATTEQPTAISLWIYPQGTTSTKQLNIMGQCVEAVDKQPGTLYGWWSNSATATYFVVSKSGGATWTGTVYLYKLALS